MRKPHEYEIRLTDGDSAKLVSSRLIGQLTYTVTKLNAAGAGSFAEAGALPNSEGQDSRIEFAVSGTIHPSARYELTAGNCTICAN